METVQTSKGLEYKIIGVWHYSSKCVVLIDMGLCFLLKQEGMNHEVVKVCSAIDVPKIGKEVANTFHDWQVGKLKETHHKIKLGTSKYSGYQTGTAKAIEMM